MIHICTAYLNYRDSNLTLLFFPDILIRFREGGMLIPFVTLHLADNVSVSPLFSPALSLPSFLYDLFKMFPPPFVYFLLFALLTSHALCRSKASSISKESKVLEAHKDYLSGCSKKLFQFKYT